MKDHFISVYQARYATYFVPKYLYNDTVNKSTNFYKTTFPSDSIFTKAYACTSNDQIDNLTSKFNTQYRACIGSLICFLYTRVDLSFAVHKLSKFSSNPGKENFERLVHLLRYIRYNKTLGFNYYADMNVVPVSYLLIQAIIKTDNQLMVFSYSIWQYCPEIGRIIRAYIIFYQGVPINHGTHVPGPVAQSSS